jgi:glycerol-3-phosphate dehydrogenase
MVKMNARNFLVQRYEIDPDIARYLTKSYGERAFDVAKFFDLDKRNKERLSPNHPFTVGELRYNIRYEMAIKPTDFLFRRTRLGFIDSEAINVAFPKLMDIFAEENKWPEEKKNEETKENFEHIRKMNF